MADPCISEIIRTESSIDNIIGTDILKGERSKINWRGKYTHCSVILLESTQGRQNFSLVFRNWQNDLKMEGYWMRKKRERQTAVVATPGWTATALLLSCLFNHWNHMIFDLTRWEVSDKPEPWRLLLVWNLCKMSIHQWSSWIERRSDGIH